MKTIYDIGLHESITIDGVKITREPGCWVYLYPNKQPLVIDYNPEFKKVRKRIVPEEIVKYVEGFYNLQMPITTLKTKGGNYPLARKVICTILNERTTLKKGTIAKYAGFKNGNNLNWYISSLSDLFDTEDQYKAEYEAILKGLNLR